MLRCNEAGLIPLLRSGKYGAKIQLDDTAFESLLRHESYYLLSALPTSLADRLLRPAVPMLLAKQRSNGLWKVKDAERITYNILCAFRHIGLLDPAHPGELLPYDPLAEVSDRFSLYALLIKDLLLASTPEDDGAKAQLMQAIQSMQQTDGSWEQTVVGTVVHMEVLLSLGLIPEHPAIQRAMDFILRQYHEDLEGIHIDKPYGLVTHGVFTTADRHAEFLSAQRNKPEWIPSEVCFRTMGVITNSVCLSLLLSLGMEGDARVETALDNLYSMHERFGGFCATKIKKPFIG